MMRGIGLGRVKRGLLVVTLGAACLAPAATAQACPPAHAPAYGWFHFLGTTHGGANGFQTGGSITGHRIG